MLAIVHPARDRKCSPAGWIIAYIPRNEKKVKKVYAEPENYDIIMLMACRFGRFLTLCER